MRRRLLVLMGAILANYAYAWDSCEEMESDMCIALTNDNYLVSETFTNQLITATCFPVDEIRAEAYIMLSISSYQNFLFTADALWLEHEMSNASNAVVAIGSNSDVWQYWMARFTYASAHASELSFTNVYSIATNTLAEIALCGYTNGNSSLEAAILQKFEMPNLSIEDAMKVMAGMSAAELGMTTAATNFANQLAIPYRNIILDFIRQ